MLYVTRRSSKYLENVGVGKDWFALLEQDDRGMLRLVLINIGFGILHSVNEYRLTDNSIHLQ